MLNSNKWTAKDRKMITSAGDTKNACVGGYALSGFPTSSTKKAIFDG